MIPYRETPKYFYAVQKGQAKARGIRFELTFEEWWGLWAPHWDRRGKGQDEYVMGRHKDEGPYALGNVSIITGRDNRIQAGPHRPRGVEHPRAVVLDEEAIREDYSTGDYSWNELASKYETSKRTIGRILKNEHLPKR